VRYDESTAERLLKLCRKLGQEYGGKLRRLLEFEGIGLKTVQIFMREAVQVWS
jgi:endonuclease III